VYEPFDVIDRYWAAKQISLRLLTSQRLEHAKLMRRLNTFCAGDHPKRFGKLNYG